MLDRHGQPEQVGRGQRGPQLAVDPVVRLLDHPHPVRVDEAVEDPVGRLADGQLLLGEREVHGQLPLWPAGQNTGRESSSS